MKKHRFLIGALLVTNASAFGQFVVPSPATPTIQSAIVAASNGDTITVNPGVYVENVDFLGKMITVQSVGGPGATFIVGPPGGGSVVSFAGGQTPATVLRGFDISAGKAGFGGGIVCNGASPTIDNCVIHDNTATSGGGGVACLGSAAPWIEDTVVSNNSTGNDGGGVFAKDTSAPRFTRCFVRSNQALRGGGFFVTDQATPELRETEIRENKALGPAANTVGGGVYCDQMSSPLLESCDVVGNRSQAHPGNGTLGGGIYCAGSSEPRIDYCLIAGNFAEALNNGYGRGGGLYFTGSSFACVRSSMISENVAFTSNGHNANTGGALYSNSAGKAQPQPQPLLVPQLLNCTIAFNDAGPGIGGADFDHPSGQGQGIIQNSIVWGNTPATQPQATANSPTVRFDACDVQGGWTGTGFLNVNLDPLFLAPPTDLRLTAGSPVIDAGISTPFLPFDFDGNPRTVGFAPDMGAFEFPGQGVLYGTGHDFAMGTLVNGTGNAGVLVKHAAPGSILSVDLFSPNGTFDTSSPTGGSIPFLVGETYPTGGSPPAGLAHPALHISAAGLFVLFNNPPTPLGFMLLPPGGLHLDYKLPPALLGMTLRIQGVAIKSGTVAASDAHEIIVP